MRFLIWYLVLAECLVFFTQAQDRHNTCPGIEPMQDFQMSRFLGEWYAIQDTAMNSKCITYNYRQVQEPGSYVMLVTEYISQDTNGSLEDSLFLVHPLIFPSSVLYSLTVFEPSTPGRKESNYYVVNLDGVNHVPYVVFMTDYDTYAGVLAYPPNSSGYTATIFSRTRMLDQMHVDKIRQKLSQCGFDVSNLKIIEHSDCPERSFSVTVPYNDTAYITI